MKLKFNINTIKHRRRGSTGKIPYILYTGAATEFTYTPSGRVITTNTHMVYPTRYRKQTKFKRLA